MDQADPEMTHYVALGQRNAEVIELFARFCRNVRVEAMGGVGMIEAQTGLPIGHRAFRCAYASGRTAFSMHLEDVAVEFYEEHCRGCADRVRSGLLGENIATLAEAQRSASQARAERERAEADMRLRRREERSSRRLRRSTGEPYPSAAQLERVDRLDPPDGSPESSDIEWLVRTALLGPEVISEATVAELVELARGEEVPWATREAAQAVLVPLTAAGRVPEAAAALIALANLSEGPGAEAGKLLVAAGNAMRAESVTAKVARSVVELAGSAGDPWAQAMSRFSGKAIVADPAPLLLCAARNLEAVVQVIEQMLASAAVGRQSPVVLVGPDGQSLRAAETPASEPLGAADRPRSIAAAACLPLIEATPSAAPRLVAALARSLEIPDQDRYDAPPSKTIGRTLGLALLRVYADVEPSLEEAAHRITEEARVSLFGAVSTALHALDENGGPAAGPRLVQLTVDRLQGDWGEQVATEAALALRDLARFHPDRLAGRAGGLVGSLIVEITRPAGSATGLVVPGDPLFLA